MKSVAEAIAIWNCAGRPQHCAALLPFAIALKDIPATDPAELLFKCNVLLGIGLRGRHGLADNFELDYRNGSLTTFLGALEMETISQDQGTVALLAQSISADYQMVYEALVAKSATTIQ